MCGLKVNMMTKKKMKSNDEIIQVMSAEEAWQVKKPRYNGCQT